MTDDTQHDQPAPAPDDGSPTPEDGPAPESTDSGSRWEPADAASAPPYVSASLHEPPPPADRPETRRPRRGRLALIGAAAAAAGLVVGGASGFAVGHATSDDDRGELSFEHGGFPGHHDRDGFAPPGAPPQGDDRAPSTDGDDGADT